MRKVLSWILTLFLAVIVAVFAISNRANAIVDFWPFPITIEAPLYLLLGVIFALGLLIGGAVTWLSGLKARRAARRRATP